MSDPELRVSPLSNRLGRLIAIAALSAVIESAMAEVDQAALREPAVRVGCQTAKGFSQGSGFLVGVDGRHVLTNEHVIDQCVGNPKIIVARLGREAVDTREVRVIWRASRDPARAHLDAALLALPEAMGRGGVRFATNATVTEGDRVWTMGFPGAADEVASQDAFATPSGSAGTISRINSVKSDRGASARHYQITAAINPGSSGGPLYNEFGEVIGINTLKSLVAAVTIDPAAKKFAVTRVPSGEAIGWAQQIDDLLPVLREHQIDSNIRIARRSGIELWIARDPVTAGAIGIVVVLGALGFLLLTFRVVQQKNSNDRAKPIGRLDIEQLGVPSEGQVVGIKGDYRGSTIPVTEEVVFGRSASECNVVFPSSRSEISARHCSLNFDQAKRVFYLRDLTSANGTFAGRRRLRPGETVVLKPGDHFFLVHQDNRFQVILR